MEATIRVLQQDADLNYDVVLDIMRSGINRNDWDYQNVDKYASTFAGTPILCAYLPGRVADGHNMDEYRLPDGEMVYDFTGPYAERIVGAISDNPEDIVVHEVDGEKWVTATGKLWRFYNRQLCDKIAEQGRMSVSAETEVMEEHQNDNISVFTVWRGLGVTVLNETVAPAVPGANIRQALKAMEAKWTEMKLAAASYHPKADEETPSDSQKLNQQKPDGAEAEPPENKSQGVKQALIYNKKQLETLAKRFPEYILLAASKDDETGAIKVKMRNASFDLYSYEMQSEGETVVPERFQPFFASVDLGDGVSMDANDYNDQMAAELRRMTADKTAAEDELKKTREALNKMQENEKKRRIEVSKAAVKRALENFNANRTVKVDEAAVAEVLKKAEDGDYTTCEDGEGCWTGEAAAERDCLAECAKKDIEIQAKLAKDAAQKEKNVHIWEKLNDNSAGADDGSVGALLKRLKIKE